jgi:hypothetical protein
MAARRRIWSTPEGERFLAMSDFAKAEALVAQGDDAQFGLSGGRVICLDTRVGRPARTRSMIISRSNSANDPITW